MHNYTTNKPDATTFEFIVTVGKEEIKDRFDKLLEEALTEVEVEGFRKGKAPRDLAEKQIDRNKVYQKVISNLLADVYQEIVTKEGIHPVVQPRVQLTEAKEGEDWKFTLSVAEKPVVTVGDAKKIVEAVKSKENKTDIWVPGKEIAVNDKEAEQKKMAYLNKILEGVLQSTKIDISPLIIEDEVNRRMTQLLDDVRKIGMNMDDYARSKNTSIEAIKQQYKKEVNDMYAIEFALDKIADETKIVVEQAELEALFSKITDEKQKEEMKKNSYLYASVIKRQKTLDYLLSL